MVFDKNFFSDIKSRKLESKPSVLFKLMRINDKAEGHKRTHNVMSKKIFDSILDENTQLERSILRCSFFDFDKEEIEKITDETERTIKLAIDLLDEKPNRSIILTSDDMLEKYKSSPHFIDVKEIDVKAGKDALAVIDSYFLQCTEKNY